MDKIGEIFSVLDSDWADLVDLPKIQLVICEKSDHILLKEVNKIFEMVSLPTMSFLIGEGLLRCVYLDIIEQ